MHDSTSTMSESCISPVFSIAVNFQTCVPRADVLAAELAVQHRAAGDADRRQVARRRAHQQRRRRLVAAHHQHDTVERVRADRLLDVHRHLIAEQHRRRPHHRLAEAHHRKLEREAAGLEDAARSRARPVRGSAHCTASPPTRCCRCRSPAGRRTGRAECPGSSSTSGGRARRGRGGRTRIASGAGVSISADFLLIVVVDLRSQNVDGRVSIALGTSYCYGCASGGMAGGPAAAACLIPRPQWALPTRRWHGRRPSRRKTLPRRLVEHVHVGRDRRRGRPSRRDRRAGRPCVRSVTCASPTWISEFGLGSGRLDDDDLARARRRRRCASDRCSGRTP